MNKAMEPPRALLACCADGAAAGQQFARDDPGACPGNGFGSPAGDLAQNPRSFAVFLLLYL
jgi:hypothetical protein